MAGEWDVVDETPVRRKAAQAANDWDVVEEAPVAAAPAAPQTTLGESLLSRAKAGVASTVGGALQAFGERMSAPLDALQGTVLGDVFAPAAEPFHAVADAGVSNVELADAYRREAGGVAPESFSAALGDPENTARYYGGILAESAPAIAAAMLTRNPQVASGIVGATTGAAEYGQSRAAGAGQFEALQQAGAAGLIETGLGTLPFEQAMGGGSFLSRLGRTTATEGLTEATTEAGQTALPSMLGDAPLDESAFNRAMFDALVVGSGMGAGEAAIGSALPAEKAPIGTPIVPPTAPVEPRVDTPPTNAIDPTPALGDDAELDALLLRNLPPEIVDVVQNLPPEVALGALGDPNPVPAAATPASPATEPRDSAPARDASDLAAAMRMLAQTRAAQSADVPRARTVTPPSQDIAAPAAPTTPAAEDVQASAAERLPAVGTDLAGTLYQRGNGKNNSSAQALRLPDGSWRVRNRKAGQWQAWEARDSFDPSPAFGYRETGMAGGAVNVPGMGKVTVQRTDREQRTPDYNPLLDMIANSGGIARADARRFGVDPAEMNRRRGIRPLFSDKGVPLDQLRERLLADGYLPPEPEDAPPTLDLNDVWELVDRAMSGKPVAPMDDPRMADYMAEQEAMRFGPEETEADRDPDDDLARWFDEASPDEPILAGDEAEAASVVELAERAAREGADGFDIAPFTGESDGAYAARLWQLIQQQEANRGPVRKAETGNLREGVQQREAGQAQPVQDFALDAPAQAPAAQEVAPASAGLFGAPSAREFIDDASRRRDAARNGQGAERTDMLAGEGELFAGRRPEQARVDDPPLESQDTTEAVEVADEDLTEDERTAFNRQTRSPAERNALATLRAESARERGESDAGLLRESVRKAVGDAPVRVAYTRGQAGLKGLVNDSFIQQLEDRQRLRGTRMRTSGLYVTADQSIDGDPLVVLFTDVVTSPELAAFTAAHEIAGHHGLRSLLGAELDKALSIAEQNPTVKAVADSMMRRRKMAPNKRLLAIEEALADLAAASRTNDYDTIAERHGVEVPTAQRKTLAGAIARFIERVKALFSRKGMAFTDAQVHDLLADAWRAGQGQARRAGDTSPMESTEPAGIRDTTYAGPGGFVAKPIPAPRAGEPWYHGRPADAPRGFADGRVAFLTRRRNGAEWFAQGEGRVTEHRIDVRNPARLRDLEDVLREQGYEVIDGPVDGRLAERIAASSPYEGTNEIDAIYIPEIREALASKGFDGLLVSDALENDSHEIVVVWNPAQIDADAALESVDYTPEQSAEARRATAATTLPVDRGTSGWNYDEGVWDGKKGALKRARAELQDKMTAWADVQGQIEAQLGRALPDAQNVRRLENLMHGRASEAIDRIEREQVEPLVQAMKAAGVDLATLEEYLYARHAQERNAQIASINPKMPDGGSGMTNAEAAAILAGADKAKLDPLAKRVDAITRTNRRRLLDNGLVTQEAHDAMAAQYQFYVPLRGQAEARRQQQAEGSRGVDSRRAPVKQALGRGAGNRATNLLGEIVGDAQRGVILGEKARVGRAVMRIVLANPNPDLWTLEPVQTERALDANGEVYEKVVTDWSDPSIVAVRHKGQLYRVQFEQPELAQALNHVGVDSLGDVTRVAGAINRYFSAVLTKYNPAFTGINMTRDALFGLTGLAVEHGELAALDAALHYPQAARAAYRQARGKPGDSEWDRNAREFAEAGGKTGYVNMPSVEDLQRKIGKGRFGGYSPEGAARAARVIADFVGDANDAVENALRLSAFVTLRKRGMSAEQAAEVAKNLTVNFNRKGFSGSKINAWFLFYNAAMQGAHRAGKLFKQPKTYAYLGTLAAIQAVATLAALGYEDDEGEPLWNKIPDHVKRRNIVIVRPDGLLITIPMPYGFNVFPYAAGRIVGALADGETRRTKLDDRPARIASDIVVATVDGMFPVPITEGAFGLAPEAVGIPLAIQANRDDFGRAIRREDPYAKSDTPRASMGRPDTLELFKLTATGLNRVGGGDALTPPDVAMMDVAPEDIEYLLQKAGGGTLKFVIDTATLGQQAAGIDSGEEVKLRDVPILSRFVTSIDDQAAKQAQFYQRRDVIERAKKHVLAAYESEGSEPAEKLLASLPELSGAAFRRRKRDGDNGPAGSIIEVDGRPQFVAVKRDSVFAAYKAADEAMSARNEMVEAIYAATPASVLPTKESRQRDAMVRRENTIRQAAQAELARLWIRDVVGAAE